MSEIYTVQFVNFSHCVMTLTQVNTYNTNSLILLVWIYHKFSFFPHFNEIYIFCLNNAT